MGQLDIRPINTVRPITEQLDHGPITTVRYITEQLDIGPINVTCNFCATLYWINKRVSISQPSNPRFKACYKHGDVNLPLF